MSDPLATINTRRTSQSEQADSRQVRNSAGGFTFTISPEDRIRRFLVLGTTGGTYYQSETELTKENATDLIAFAANDPVRLVEILTEVSLAGRAPKQNPTIFALAAAAASPVEAGRKAAFDAMPQVLRTGTHLMLFVKYVQQFRGWGTGLKKAGQRWFLNKPLEPLTYQMVKYRQREGFTQRDLLRLIHPKTADEGRNALFRWVTQGDVSEALPGYVKGFLKAQEATTVDAWTDAVNHYGLSWEMLPDAALKEPKVWSSLLDKGIPMTALIRQLPRLTNLELIGSALKKGDRTEQIVAQLTDQERLTKARVHPFNLLVAQRTYASGRSFRGSSTWEVSKAIADAIDQAFYLSYGNVVPANKRTMVALDVSGSMGVQIQDSPITAREASAAMSLITTATEPWSDTYAFTGGYGGSYGRSKVKVTGEFTQVPISPLQRLDDVLKLTGNLPFGRTDCALPMVKALEMDLEVDTFTVITDNETWAGNIHPHQALRRYRDKTGIPARLVVWGMTATPFSIADPNDAGMLDIAGLDSAAPQLLADFSRGDI